MRKLTEYCVSLLGSVAILLMIPAIAAAQQAGQQPGGGLTITHVGVNFSDDTILITGENFDFGPGPLQVILDTLGDISADCTLNTPEEIECDLSGGGLPSDGDHLLIVANGVGQSQGDEYDLTIVRTVFTDGGLVYTNRDTKGDASGGEALANNKFQDVACDAGDILLSGGVQLGGSDAGGNTAATIQQLANNLTILENRPLGGATKWRGRAHETPVNGIGSRTGWQITTWAVCLDTN